MIKYLALDTIDIVSEEYPNVLKSISISMRGTKNLFDIFFSIDDVETSFNITLPTQIDFTWINTPSGKEKYLSYPTIKRMLFQLKDDHELVEPYLKWIDSLLFSNTKVKPFFRDSCSNSQITNKTEETEEIDNISDLDDTESIVSFSSRAESDYILSSLQHKVETLEQQLKLKDKDIEILHRDVEIRNKEIELLNLRLSIPSTSNWI